MIVDRMRSSLFLSTVCLCAFLHMDTGSSAYISDGSAVVNAAPVTYTSTGTQGAGQEEELYFSSCKCSSLDDATTVCKNAIDRKQDDCVTHSRMFVSGVQESTMSSSFKGHWFIGYFDAPVQLDSIVYHPRISSFSKDVCRMCHFEVYFQTQPSVSSSGDFIKCNSYKGSVFTSKVMKCESTTKAVKIVNKKLTRTKVGQHLEICEIYGLGKKIAQDITFDRCFASGSRIKEAKCENAKDGKSDDCSNEGNNYVSLKQPTTGRRSFTRLDYGFFMGIFDFQVQVVTVVYHARTEPNSIAQCRMCHFDVMYSLRNGNNKDYRVCATYKGEAFRKTKIECETIATAIAIVNQQVSRPPHYPQYLEICELYVIGYKLEGAVKIEELTFSDCKRSSIYSVSTDCEKATDGKQDNCAEHTNNFISALQKDSLDSTFMGHYFIGYFGTMVLLDSIIYIASTGSFSKKGCRMCLFDVLYQIPFTTSDTDFAICNGYNGTVFTRKLMSCRSATTAVKIMNRRVTKKTTVGQYLEICEIYALGVKLDPEDTTVLTHAMNYYNKDTKRQYFSDCSQSSTFESRSCHFAKDGLDEGCSYNQISHTNEDQQAWWKGTFVDFVIVLSVRIANRQNRKVDRLIYFSILLDDDVLCYNYKSSASFNYITPMCAFQIQTKSVKIRFNSKTDKQYLELCEVSPFGSLIGMKLEIKNCEQRSTFVDEHNTNTSCKLAIDGVSKGCNYGQVSHTLDNPREWWTGYLSTTMQLLAVNIFNRLDCCEERLVDIMITGDGDHVCSEIKKEISTVSKLFLCQDGFLTKTVKIARRKKNWPANYDTKKFYLSLCEVEAFGIHPPTTTTTTTTTTATTIAATTPKPWYSRFLDWLFSGSRRGGKFKRPPRWG